MSPREEYHTVRLPKGWTPARIQRFADAVNAIGQAQRLGTENAALRRERRALRSLLRVAVGGLLCRSRVLRAGVADEIEKALKPRKARRRKA